MTGCKSKQNTVKEVLKNKYNEEFIVYEVNTSAYGGDNYHAMVSPKNNEEVVFEVEMYGDKLVNDDYLERYAAKLMNDILKEDLEEFFPGAYIRTRIYSLPLDGEIEDFSTLSIEDILKKKTGEGSIMLEIYYDKKVGTNKEYQKEYEYFDNKVDEYVDNNQMLPITTVIYKMDKATISRVKEYFESDLKEDSLFQKNVLGVNYFEGCFFKDTGDYLGKPTHISACFEDQCVHIESCEEYIRRRELLENAE